MSLDVHEKNTLSEQNVSNQNDFNCDKSNTDVKGKTIEAPSSSSEYSYTNVTDDFDSSGIGSLSSLEIGDGGFSESSGTFELKSPSVVEFEPQTNTTPTPDQDTTLDNCVEEITAQSESEISEKISDSRETIPDNELQEVSNDRDLTTCLKSKLSKSYIEKKRQTILSAFEENDINSLINAAKSPGGLLSDDIRRMVWPKLLGIDLIETAHRPSQEEIEQHPYYQQVVLDVNRSIQRFPPSIKETQRLMMLDQLVQLIMRVLCRHPNFHYYQGYHDICVTFLLVLGEEMAFHVVEKISQTHLSVFMAKTMEPTIHILEHIYFLIGLRHKPLREFLLKSEVGIAFCVSWLITWFGHVLNDYDDVVRLFDFFIVCHPWMPLYITSAVVLHRKSEILLQDCDMASVHHLLSRIPDDLPFEDFALEALSLFKTCSPDKLKYVRPYRASSKSWELLRNITRRIKSVMPRTKVTVPLVIATAVVIYAIMYQSYKN